MKKKQEGLLEEYEEKRGSNFSAMMRGLLIGGLIGAGVALLSAPQTGEETKAMIREKVEDARLRTEEVARKGADRATVIQERGKSLVNEQKNTLESVVVGVKEGVRTYKEQGGLDLTGSTDIQSLADFEKATDLQVPPEVMQGDAPTE